MKGFSPPRNLYEVVTLVNKQKETGFAELENKVLSSGIIGFF